MSTGDDLIRFIGGLRLSGGDHDGEAFEVLRWQRRFLRGAFGQDGDAALSVARANGKSALCAAVATAVLDPEGPLHGRRREVVCAASSFQQARVIFEDSVGMLRHRHPDLLKVFRLQDSANVATVEHRETGSRLRVIGSDPRRAHGLRPALVLADEPAQWAGTTAERMVSALRTSMGKVSGGRLIALGTRPETSDHWFAKMLEHPGTGYAQVHAAREGDPDFRLTTIRRANPSWDHLSSLRARVLRERDEAKLDPVMLATWRSLRLNMGVSDTVESVLLDAATWAAAEGDVAAEGRCYWGVDLGTSAAQSAIAAYWPESGRLEAVSAFPAVPDLRERGLRDGCGRLYLDCYERGELVVSGQRSVEIGGLLEEALERFGAPSVVIADRWREAELRDALEGRVPVCELAIRGQGFRDGGEDLRSFRRAFLSDRAGRPRPVPSLLLRSAMAEARAVSDAAGNAKLAKRTQGGRRSTARDDAAAAAILAVAVGWRAGAVRRPRRRRSAIV